MSVPATLTVPASATSATFAANVLLVTPTQNVTLTAVAGGVAQPFVLQLNADVPTLSVATSGSPSAFGAAVTFTATISSGPSGVVTFYDDGTSIGTSTINGTIATFTTSSLAAGSHTITAGWPGNSNYGPVSSGAITQMVNETTPTIAWNAPAPISYGTALSSAQLDASSSVAGSFSYSPALGTVLTAGTHSITAIFTPIDATDYLTATSSVSITVNAAIPAITWSTPAAITYGTSLSATQLDATSTVAGNFSYTPASGTVLQAGSQTLYVTFTPADSTDYKTATATVGLTVNAGISSITWTPPAAITYGTALSSTQLNATSTLAGTFVYSPAAGSILKAGTQTLSVTFTPTDTADYQAETATVALTVNAGIPAITWSTPVAITYGTPLSATQLDATSTVAGTFSYTPASGTVLQAGGQTLSVTFKPADSTDYNTATATVGLTVNAGASSINWTPPAAIAYGTPLSASQLDATSTLAGTFVYSPGAGTILKAGEQTLSVTFTPTNPAGTAATATMGLTVNPATPSITWTAPSAITYGTTLSATQLNATSTVSGSFSYSPAAGTMLPVGKHSITATFTPTDSTDYATVTSSVSITVNATTPVITWPTPASITYGTVLSATQLNASSTVAGSFTYSPAAGTVLTAGAHVITATFTPTDSTDYSAATSSVSIKVNVGTPVINWATPAAITYGTSLSGSQLDATSTIPGTFVYSPTAGAVLAVGSQTLSVTFTPTDTTDYATATQSVALTVNAATPTLGINAASVPFGNVTLNTPTTQDVTLTSTGTAAVTINSAAVTGSGFTLSSGPTFPVTLTPGQTATLGVEFDPTTGGAAMGQLTIISTSSTNGTAVISLTGTGTAASYAVDLSWDAPSGSTDPIAGYNVFRSPSGSSLYQLLNSSVDSQTAYVDSTVQSGQSYDYIVESVDDSGVESVPTNPITVAIP